MADEEKKLTQDEVDQDAYNWVMSAKEHFRNQRRVAGYETQWAAFEKSYNNDTDSFYSGLCKVRVPALHNAIETVVPIIDKGSFPPDGNFLEAEADDLDNQFLVEEALRAKLLLKDQFRDVDARAKLIGVARSLCIYGTVFVKTYWEHIVKCRYKRDENGKRVKVWETVFDNPDFYNVEIRNIYADIKDENLDGIVIEGLVKDYQDLWDNRERTETVEYEDETSEEFEVGVYRNVEQFKQVKFVRPVDSEKIEGQENMGLARHSYGEHEHKIEVYECWGMIPKYLITRSLKDKEEKTYCDGLIVVGNGAEGGKGTLRISDNPFDHQEKPYIRCRYIKVDGRLYGMGVMTVNIPLEAELNTSRQQAVDMNTKNLRPKWLIDGTAEIDENSLKDTNDQCIVTANGNANAVVPLRPNDMTNSALANQANAKADIAEGTGAKGIVNGTPNGSSIERTSVGVSALYQSALGRLDLVAINYEEELLKKLARHFWMLDQQFMDQPREVQISGKGMVKVDPKEIPLPRMHFLGMKTLGEKDMRINQANILIQNLSPFAQYGIDPVPILLEQLRLMGWGHIINEIDTRPESDMEDTPEGEVRLLQMGRKVKININDDHAAFINAYTQLLNSGELPPTVKFNTEEALGQRKMIMEYLNNFNDITNLIKSKQQIESKGTDYGAAA